MSSLSVLKKLAQTYVMRISLVVTLTFHFMHHHRVPLVFLISYIVIYGHHLFPVSLDSNTI